MNSTATPEVTDMPCQCGTTATADIDSVQSGCGCETESSGGCGCGSSPDPSDHEKNLERVVMELDKRVRKLEGSI